MELIHVERTSATTDEQRLGFLLKARAKAAEQVVAANLRAQACKIDLIEHVTRRLQAGDDRVRLRHRLLESGMPPSAVDAVLSAATDATREQQETPHGRA
jgi:hypothetical protein